MRKVIFLGACALSLSGCATIVSGTTQQIAFVTNPPGGDCTMVRKGTTLGTIHAPGSIVVKKTKDDINVTCTKQDYLPTTAFMKSKVQDSTFGNILIGGIIGVGIDAANGAINKYDSPVIVTLAPEIKNAQPTPSATQDTPAPATGNDGDKTPAAVTQTPTTPENAPAATAEPAATTPEKAPEPAISPAPAPASPAAQTAPAPQQQNTSPVTN